MSDEREFEFSVEMAKYDESLGLLFGHAIICKKNGEPYFDRQGDHIPEDAMLEASLDFMRHSRIADEMHKVDEKGTVVFAMPVTDEVADAFGWQVDMTGLAIAMYPDEDMLAKFRKGELTAFSIGGVYLDVEEVEE